MSHQPRKKTYKDYPTQAQLHELFWINARGQLVRKKRSGKRGFTKKGDVLKGRRDKYGNLRTSINKRGMLVHSVIWMMLYGYYPSFIGHRDGNKSNNRPDNLFEGYTKDGRHHDAKRRNSTYGARRKGRGYLSSQSAEKFRHRAGGDIGSVGDACGSHDAPAGMPREAAAD